MRTFPNLDERNGLKFAFEVENLYISIPTAVRVLSMVNGVTDVRRRKAFTKWEGYHAWFKFNGREFVIWEPHGDSSRYWIGPLWEEDRVDVSELQAAFERHNPSPVVTLFADLVSLRFLRRPWGNK